MERPGSSRRVESAEVERLPMRSVVRPVLLALAAVWFLFAAFMRIDGDPARGLVDLTQRLAFGFALVAVALIDWRRFRWWWLLLAVLVVAVVWTATDHPLLFLVGGY
jgi:glucan phosphoethanolaminetransferase (alkaline phosphatase superfamily)